MGRYVLWSCCFVWETFLQLLLLFDVCPTLCNMSVNGVVARLPVVRTCLSSDNYLFRGHLYSLSLSVTVPPLGSESFTSYPLQRTDEVKNCS